MGSGAGGTVAVAGALAVEVAGLRRSGVFSRARIENAQYFRGDIRGTDVALLVSGMGETCAYETARAACASLPVRAYISIGLSGSLSPDIGTGDIVIGERIITLASRGFGEYCSDPELLNIAYGSCEPGETPVAGRLLAGDRVVVTSAEKKTLASSFGCLAIDMETAGAARAALNAGVPFLPIRAISDGLDDDLPLDFNLFRTEGRMDWPRFIFHVLAHPGTIRPLARLGKNSRLAVDNLTRAVERVLGNLP